MKEYTILALAAALLAVALDFLLKTGLVRQKRFWIFWIVMAALKTVANGYLTWRPIVQYGESFFLGLRVITIPVEDYVYGFALITMNVVLWEYFTKKFRVRETRQQEAEHHG